MALFIIITIFLNLVSAQACWKNTTCSGPTDTAWPGPWEANIYAPSSRKVPPKNVLSAQTGNILFNYSGSIGLSGNGSKYVLDYGKEVGGLVTFKFTSTGPGAIGLAFTEAKNYIGEWSDSSNGGFKGPDGAIYANFSSAGTSTYTMPDAQLRGGFRYLTLFLITNGTTSVNVSDIILDIGFQPTWSNLRAYQGYFHCNDEMLNKIWYSGAYTLQTNAVPPNTGRQIPTVKIGWANNATMSPGDTVITDGAKRDRAVWPGDMGIAVPSTFVSVGDDLDSVKNALQVMYNYQNSATGAFPEAGPPLLQLGSDTYHMWTMIGTYNYVLYTNDTSFLIQNWAKYLKAMDYVYGKVSAPGLLEVTGIRDWARWQQGYNNSEAQMIALELIRRSWGWYLNNPNGTESTVIEGYLQNATFAYRSSRGYMYDTSYVSHAHGWSSGPTSALTEYVLGLSVTSRIGATWKLAPQFGDLTNAEGGFVTKLGKFQASWKLASKGYTLNYTVPAGTTGQVIVPVVTAGVIPSIKLDGKDLHGKSDLQIKNGGVAFAATGGKHTIVVS
ncbi:alpha-L-rhamnosidase B protein [Rutstroemia sp. NJR-2017a BVV2]|nr:alpha-L-rhamnosidase B protein [Rutstroemia sp. NJR-2017a BVV2]